MSQEQTHIDWDKLITILEKPVSERQLLIAELSQQEQETITWLQQMHTDELITGALQLDSRQAWQQTKEKIENERKETPVRTMRFNRKWWIAAACLLIAAGAGWWWWQQLKPAPAAYETLAQGLSGHTPAQKIQLVTADGHTIIVDSVQQLREKDGTAIQLQQDAISYQPDVKAVPPEGNKLFNTLIVPRGYLYQLTLADGSKVWLNADSKIKFPVHFDKTARRVELQGEAYFEVVHHDSWPFYVNIAAATGPGSSEVKVLGTSFDVKAYGGNNIFTTLVTGSVSFAPSTGNPIRLTPDHQAIFDTRAGTTITKAVTATDYTSWKDDDLVMSKMSMAELAEILERRYDVQLAFTDDQLKDIQYNAALHLTGNVIDMLNTLEQTGKVRFAMKNKKIFILPAIDK